MWITCRSMSLALSCCGPAVSLGQVLPTAPFAGAQCEGFETMPNAFFAPQVECFAGQATANQVGGSLGIAVVNVVGGYTGSFGPRGGIRLMGSWKEVAVEWVLDRPAKRFGGYFGTGDWSPGAVAKLYDSSGTLMASIPMACPNARQWHWDGWRALGSGFKRVRIVGNAPEQGLLVFDDLELDFDYCYPDCNANAFLGVGDFACFQQKFVAQDPYADCSGDGQLTIGDFSCFQMSFVAGCP